MKNILKLLILFTGLVSWGQSPEYLYYDNGDVMRQEWRDGNHKVTKRETYQQQNQGGQLQKVENYKNGQRHGVQEEYNRDGNLLTKNMYTNGEWTKRLRYCTYYENGQLMEDHLPVYKKYYENGQIMILATTEGGKEYYESGQLKRDGDKEYYESGQLKKDKDKEYYENGRLKKDKDKEYYESGQLKRDGDKRYREITETEKKFKKWCEENGKDSSVVKSLMEYLWKEEVVKLECTTGEDGVEVYFEPTQERKDWAKYVIYDLFDKEFKSIFPQVDAFSDGWDDAFNYWYDKQKNECGF